MRKRISRLAVVGMLCSFFAGCVVFSENGLGLADGSDAIFDPSLVGTWRATNFKRFTPDPDFIQVERGSVKSSEYIVTFPDAPGKKKPLHRYEGVRLIRLGEAEFLDADLTEPKDDSHTHVIMRVRHKDDRLVLDQINAEYFRKQLEQEPMIKAMGVAMITADTATLRKFVRENARNDAAWKAGDRVYMKDKATGKKSR